jgi:hypothetical protein
LAGRDRNKNSLSLPDFQNLRISGTAPEALLSAPRRLPELDAV